jgi:small subunit ribosomal protein S3
MGQKVNPVGLRLGIIKGWESGWYGGRDFADKLVEDEAIRKYIRARIQRGGISKIVIERTMRRVTITIHTSRPGVVIGKAGQEVDKIKEELKKITSKDVQINIIEIKRPELDAKLIGETIAQQLEARMSHRRTMKQAIANALRVGAQGIKIKLSGRLAGAEMARVEEYKKGRVPLHTLRADIDYAISEALTIYGKIGIKVWVFRGEVYGRVDLSPNSEQAVAATGGTANNAGGSQARRGGGGGYDGENNNRRQGNGNNQNNNNRKKNNNQNNNRGGNNNNRGGGGGGKKK